MGTTKGENMNTLFFQEKEPDKCSIGDYWLTPDHVSSDYNYMLLRYLSYKNGKGVWYPIDWYIYLFSAKFELEDLGLVQHLDHQIQTILRESANGA